MEKNKGFQDGTDLLKWIISQALREPISQLLIFLVLNARMCMHILEYKHKHSSDGKSCGVS